VPITYINSSGVTGGVSNVPIPLGAIQGDLLIIVATGPGVPVAPADWTVLVSQGAAQYITIFYKFFSGSTASVDLTGGWNRAYMLAYSGVAATSSISAFTTVTGTSLATGTLTTAIVNEYVLSVYASSSGTTSSWTAPASTNVRASNGSGATTGGLLVVDELQAAAGVSTARTATVSVSRALSAVQISITSNDRFWVGGSGTWNNSSTANWSYTSGGASGAPAPTVNDIANFDANSGTAATVTVASTAVAFATSVGKADINLTLSGNATLAGSGTAGNMFSLVEGTVNLSGFTLSAGIFNSSNINNRTVSFGSGSIALTSTVTTPFTPRVLNMATVTNFTWTGTGGFTRDQTASTAFIALGSDAGGSATTAPNFAITAGGNTVEFVAPCHLKTLSFTGSTCSAQGTVTLYGNLTLAIGGTYTNVTANFRDTATVTSNGKILSNVSFNPTGTLTLADALTLGATRTFTLVQGTLNLAGFTLSTGAFSSDNTNTRAITFGSGNIVLTSTTTATIVLDMSNATNFTWTGTGGFTRNNTVNTFFQFGVTGGTVTNAPNLSITAGFLGAITITSTSWFNNLSFAGNSISPAVTAVNICGNLTLGSATSYANVSPTFRDSGVIASNGKTIGAVSVNGAGITVTLASALSSGASLVLTQGTLDFAGFAVSVLAFSATGSSTRTLLMGASAVTLSGSGTAWDTSTVTGLTLNSGTSTINLSSATAKTFTGGGLTYYNINQAGAGALTIDGPNTFNDITNTYSATGATSVLFTSGTLTTFNAFSLTGVSGRVCTLTATSGTQAILSKPGGWAVGANSTDGGGNTGLSFTAGGGIDFLAISNINGVAGVSTYNVFVAETASGVDAVSSSRVFFGAVTEASSGLDAISALAVLRSAVAEATSGVDGVSAQALFSRTVDETASVSDQASSRQTFAATLLEIASGVDSDLSASSVFNTSVLESITALDLFSALYLWNLIDDGQTPNWQNVSNAQSPTWTDVNDGQTPNWQNVSNAQSPTWTDVNDSQTPGWTPINS
jgi:hypothetical protein